MVGYIALAKIKGEAVICGIYYCLLAYVLSTAADDYPRAIAGKSPGCGITDAGSATGD
jgi:hypothetical protein